MRIYKAKAPMRIGFFGGGTDVSPYAEEYGGKVLNCTIDKYVRCMLRSNGEEGITIRSLDLEEVSRDMTGRWQGRLRLPQAVLDAMPTAQGVEVTMFSDVPPGSGLGSSSALVVSMLQLLCAAYDLPAEPYALAELAYRIERVDIGIPGGRQDQYAAAFGVDVGLPFRRPAGDRRAGAERLDRAVRAESCLLLGYIGDRKLLTHHLVEDQVRRLKDGDIAALPRRDQGVCGPVGEAAARAEDRRFRRLLHEAWEVKKAFSPYIASPAGRPDLQSGARPRRLGRQDHRRGRRRL